VRERARVRSERLTELASSSLASAIASVAAAAAAAAVGGLGKKRWGWKSVGFGNICPLRCGSKCDTPTYSPHGTTKAPPPPPSCPLAAGRAKPQGATTFGVKAAAGVAGETFRRVRQNILRN
jgi:hypothetical protein